MARGINGDHCGRLSSLRKKSLTLLLAIALSSGAYAQSSGSPVNLDLPPGTLVQAVNALSKQSGVQVIYDFELLKGVNVRALRGELKIEDAIGRLLEGTNLEWKYVDPSTIVVSKKTDRAQRPRAPAVSRPAAVKKSASEDPTALDTITVVGSRLGAADALPIRVITRQDIERSGASNIAKVLSDLPEVSVNNNGDRDVGPGGAGGFGLPTNSTTVQLRGLPQGTTLILVNGRRSGMSAAFAASGQFDLGNIPLSMVDRIEVLPAGAAAIYGADGLAGVINIILKKEAQGGDVSFRMGVASGYLEEQTDLTWGYASGRFSAMLSGYYSKNSELNSSERSITSSDDFRRFGGTDNRRTTGNVGNVYSLEGCDPAPTFCFVPLDQRGNLPGLSSSYAAVPIGQNGIGLTPASFSNSQGTLNYSSIQSAIFSPKEKWGASGNFSLTVNDDLEFFSELSYTSLSVSMRGGFIGMQYGEYGYSYLPASSPFNPFGVDVGVDYVYRDGEIDYEQTYSRALIGARGTLSSWEWDFSIWRSEDDSKLVGGLLTPASQRMSDAAFNAALLSMDPASAFNPLRGDGGAPGSDALMRQLFPQDFIHYTAVNTGVSANVKGTVFTLPTGEVRAAFGAEFNKDVIQYGIGRSPVNGEDTNRAYYGELRVPLVGQGNTSQSRLVASLAARRDKSDRVSENGSSEVLGLEFRPSDDVLLRGAYTTSFKPLTLFSASQITGNPFAYEQYDPVLDEYYTFAVFYGGGIPEGLLPEKGRSGSFGLMYSPSAWEGARFTLNVWDNEITNRLASISTQAMIANFPDRVTRDPVTNRVTVVDMRQVNIFYTHVRGADISLEKDFDTSVGPLQLSIAGSYTNKYDQQIAVDSPLRDNVSQLVDEGWAPRWKGALKAIWDPNDNASLSLMGKYVSRYRDSEPLSTGPNAGEYKDLGDFWIFNANALIKIGQWLAPDSPTLQGTRLSIGVDNLLNERPQFCAGCGSGYDASQADIMGRMGYLKISVAL